MVRAWSHAECGARDEEMHVCTRYQNKREPRTRLNLPRRPEKRSALVVVWAGPTSSRQDSRPTGEGPGNREQDVVLSESAKED